MITVMRSASSRGDLRVLAVIEAAGEEFYVRIASAVRNPEAAALLIQNGREERGHAHRLLKAIVAAGGEPFAGERRTERRPDLSSLG